MCINCSLFCDDLLLGGGGLIWTGTNFVIHQIHFIVYS
jgi:hypothetical protein